MKWGRHRRQQQQEQQQEQEEHPSSAFSLFRVFSLSWISKRKPTRSKPEPPQPPTISHQSSSTTPVAQPRPHALPPSKLKPKSPDLRPRAPPARLSPDRALRPSFASDHLSFSPALLDRLVSGAHEEEPDEAPRRYSCAGDDDAAPFFARNLTKGRRPFESARFHGAWTEPGFPLLSCRSCRADPERSHGWGLSGDPDASSETVESKEENNLGRSRSRRKASETAARRRPARARSGTTWDDGPSPPKDATLIARAKPAHRVPTGEHDWSSSGRTEKRRHQTPAQEPAADEQRGGARRSFSLGRKVRQRSKVKVHSPRVAAAAAAAVARAAAKERKKVAEEEEEKKRRGRSLESFAVVKCSVDPQRDFRESMEEMVRQNGMARPEEMEGLLACYLALNADEYHDVIVKVFRQVWLDLRPTRPVGSWSAAVDGGGFQL